MANRAAAAFVLRDGDREELTRLTRSTASRAGLAQRARIVLLVADGTSNSAIADKVGVSRPTVLDWRGRYEREGISGLDDDPRSGRPKQIDHGRIVSVTLAPPPMVGFCCGSTGRPCPRSRPVGSRLCCPWTAAPARLYSRDCVSVARLCGSCCEERSDSRAIQVLELPGRALA